MTDQKLLPCPFDYCKNDAHVSKTFEDHIAHVCSAHNGLLMHVRVNIWQDRTPDPALERLAGLLNELHAMVLSECRSLLDEDSGGCARLDVDICEALDEYRKGRE